MKQTRKHRYRGGGADDGQTLIFTVLLVGVLMAFAAVVVDSGVWFNTKRNLQGDADQAALAAAKELAGSGSVTTNATDVARDYVEKQNTTGGTLQDVTFSNVNRRVKVTANREQEGPFMGFFSMLSGSAKTAPTIRASATVEIAQMGAIPGMLPMAFMRNSYAIGVEAEVKFDGNATGNRGAVSPPNSPPSCHTSNGAADFRNLIRSSAFGGFDACGVEPGDTISTEPGNMAGPTRQGFDDRIGTNRDSFAQVFEYDAGSDRYSILLPTSPRVGIVPVIENTNGTTTWPNGTKDVRIVHYVLVYIGRRSSPPNYPAYTNNGREVWVTPVRTLMPDEFPKEYDLMDYSATNRDAPLVIRLVE